MGGGGRLLAVELDDELLAHGHVDVLAQRVLAHLHREPFVLGVEPRRWRAGQHVPVPLDLDHLAGLAPQADDVALADAVAGDVDPAAVDLDVAVVDELAGLGAGGRPAGPVDDVVEPALEQLQHDLAGDAALARGLLVEVAELPLVEAVGEAGLLLLLELLEVLGRVAAPAAAVLTRRVGAALQGAVLARGAPDVGAQAAGDSGLGPGVARHAWLPQTRRRLGGRQPLCGTGVTSLMPVTSMPVFWIERMAVSRPEPGPFTWTSTLRTPCSMARRAAASAAICAANGVDLRDPLKPTLPAEAHDRTLPSWSVKLMIVLLKLDLM